MLLSCLCAMALAPRQAPPAQTNSNGKLENLGRWRMAFQGKVIEHEGEIGMEETIYSMGPGEQKVFGYYPLGKSDRRFLVYMLEGWSGAKTLLYQRMSKGRAHLIWRLRLKESTKDSKFRGTLSRILHRHGIDVVGKIPSGARQALNKKFKFAAYGYGGDADLYAWTINADGSLGPEYFCGELTDHTYFPIVPDESTALGLGSKGWPPNVKFRRQP